MRLAVALLSAVLCACPLLRAAACGQQTAVTEAEYTSELQRLKESAQQVESGNADAGEVLASTPMSCTVAEAGGHTEVSFTWMREALIHAQKHPEQAQSQAGNIIRRLDLMQAQMESQPAVTDPAAAQQRLRDILARREFAEVRQPTLLDIWRDRIIVAILYALDLILSRLHLSRMTSDVLSWCVVALLLGLVVYFVARWLWRKTRRSTVAEPSAPARSRAPDWLRMTHEAAARGAYREAVHHAYWTAVARIEEGGAWRPDRARTPREYLRALPRASTAWEPFAALSRLFEHAWYGERAVSEPQFAEVLGYLEKLGCRSL